MLAVAGGSRLFSMSLAAMWENPGVLAIALGQKVGGKRPCSTGALLFLRERQSVQTAVAQGIGERFTPRHAGTHHKARPPRAQQGHPTPPPDRHPDLGGDVDRFRGSVQIDSTQDVELHGTVPRVRGTPSSSGEPRARPSRLLSRRTAQKKTG